MTQPLIIRGNVRHPDGTPAAGVRVAIAEAPVAVPDIAALTGADGDFSFAVPQPGDYVIEATADDGSATQAVYVPRAGEARLQLVLS